MRNFRRASKIKNILGKFTSRRDIPAKIVKTQGGRAFALAVRREKGEDHVEDAF